MVRKTARTAHHYLTQFLVVAVCVQLALPPQVILAQAEQVKQAAPVQAATPVPKPTPGIGKAPEATPGSREAAVRALSKTSFLLLELIRTKAPGLLRFRYEDLQAMAAPFAECRSTQPPTLKDIYEELALSQTQIREFFLARKNELTVAVDSNSNIENSYYPADLDSSFGNCRPKPQFAKPGVWPMEHRTQKITEAEQENFERLEQSEAQPLALMIGRRKPTAQLTLSEAQQWLMWLGTVHEFTETLEEQAQLLGEAPTGQALPTFSLPTEIASRIERQLVAVSHASAANALIENSDPTTPKGVHVSRKKEEDGQEVEQIEEEKSKIAAAEITAKKMLGAEQARASVSHLEPCQSTSLKSDWCFKRAPTPPEYTLRQQIVLTLETPNPNLGLTVDGHFNMIQQLSLQEITNIDPFLPDALKIRRKDIEDACVLPKAGETPLVDPRNFQAMLHSFEKYSEIGVREWWTGKLLDGAKVLANQVQQRQVRLPLPLEEPPIFSDETGKFTFFEKADQLVAGAIDRFFTEYEPSIVPGAKGMWKAQQESKNSYKAFTRFSEYIYRESGTQNEVDFASTLAFHVVTVFAATQERWIEKLTDKEWKEKLHLLRPLLKDAVIASLEETLTQFMMNHFAPTDFLSGTTGNAVWVLPEGFQKLNHFWKAAFEPRASELIEKFANKEADAVATALETALLATEPMREAVTKEASYDPDAEAHQRAEAHLLALQPKIQDAVRYELLGNQQEEVSALRTSVVRNLVPNPWSYPNLVRDLPKSSGAASLNVPVNGMTGMQLLGDIDPNVPEDYEGVRRILALIAARKFEPLKDLLKKRVTTKELEKMGLHDYESLARLVLGHFLEILPAVPSEDALYLGKLRAPTIDKLRKSLQSTTTARAAYQANTALISSALYLEEFQPFLERPERIKADNAPELTEEQKKAQRQEDQESFERWVSEIIAPRFSIPGKKPWTAQEIQKIFAESGIPESRSLGKLLEQFVEGSEILRKAGVDFYSKKSAEEWNVATQERSADLLSYIDKTETWMSNPQVRDLYNSRFASRSVVAIYNSPLRKSSPTLAKFIETKADTLAPVLVARAFHGVKMVGETDGKFVELDKAKEYSDFDSLVDAAVRDEATQAVVAIEEELAWRKNYFDQVQKKAKDFLAELQKTASATPTLTANAFAVQAEAWAKKEDIFKPFLESIQRQKDISKKLLSSLHPEIRALAYRFMQNLEAEVGRGLPVGDMVLIAYGRGVNRFGSLIAESFFPTFEQVQERALKLLPSVAAPTKEVAARIKELNKQLRDLGDVLALSKLRKDEEAIKVQEQRKNRLERDFKEATQGLFASGELVSILSSYFPNIPGAADTVKALRAATEPQHLLTRLHQKDYRKLRAVKGDTKNPPYRLDQIVEDLNHLSSRTLVPESVEIERARTVLEDATRICKLASHDTLSATLEAKYKSTLERLTDSNLPPPPQQNFIEFCKTVSLEAQLLLGESGFQIPTTSSEPKAKEKKSQGPRLETALASRFWRWLNPVAKIFLSEFSTFAPIIVSLENGSYETVWFSKSPTTSITASETESLSIQATSLISPAVMSSMLEAFERKQFAPLWKVVGNRAAVANLDSLQIRSFLSERTPDELRRLHTSLHEFLKLGMTGGVELGQMIPEWLGPNPAVVAEDQREKTWTTTLSSLAYLFQSTRDDLISDAASEKFLSLLTLEFAHLFMSGTKYRIQKGDWFLVADDKGDVLKTQSLEFLKGLVESAFKKGESTEGKRREIRRYLDSIIDILAADLRESDLKTSRTALFTATDWTGPTSPQAFLNYWVQGFLPFDADSMELLLWRTTLSPKIRSQQLIGFNAMQPLKPFARWTPLGKPLHQREDFEKWWKELARELPENALSTVRKEIPATASVRRLWDRYRSLSDMDDDFVGPVFELRNFLSRWDRNAKANGKTERSYPMLLGLLDFHIHRPDFVVGTPLANVAADRHLDLLADLIGLRVNDFDSWKDILNDPYKTMPSDWIALSRIRKAASSELVNRQFLSNWMDVDRVKNPYLGRDYPFHPVVSETAKTYENGATYRVAKTPALWRQQLASSRIAGLWKMFQSPESEAHNRMTAGQLLLSDQLLLQDEMELRMRVEAIRNGTPWTHDRYATHKDDWDEYFRKAESSIKSQRFNQIVQELKKSFPDLSLKQIEEKAKPILAKDARYVALEKAAQEIVQSHENDGKWADQFGWQGNVSFTGVHLYDQLENDLNRLLKSYASDLGVSAVPKISTRNWSSSANRREAAQELIYHGRQMMGVSLFASASEKDQDETEIILGTARNFFSREAQKLTFFRAIRDIAAKNLNVIGEICKRPTFRNRVKTQEEFYAVKEELSKKLDGPFQDGAMDLISEIAPGPAADEVRRLFNALAIETELQQQARDERDWYVRMGALVLLTGVLAARSNPGWVRWATTSVSEWATASLPAWAVAISGRLAQYGIPATIGTYYTHAALVEWDDAFVKGPEFLAQHERVRSMEFDGLNPIMSSERAADRDAMSEDVEARKWGIGPWIHRSLSYTIIWSIAVMPALSNLWLNGRRGTLRAGQRFWSWARDKFANTSFYEATLEKQFMTESERLARHSMKGIGEVLSSPPPKLAGHVDSLNESLLSTVSRKLRLRVEGNRVLLDPELAEVMKIHVRSEVESVAASAYLNPGDGTMKAIRSKSSAFEKFRKGAVSRWNYLKELESDLAAATHPSLSLEQLEILLGGQISPMQKHGLWYFHLVGLNVPSIHPVRYATFVRLTRFKNALDLKLDAAKALYNMELETLLQKHSKELTRYGRKFRMSQHDVLQGILDGTLSKDLSPELEAIQPFAKRFREMVVAIGRKPSKEMIAAFTNRDYSKLLKDVLSNPSAPALGGHPNANHVTASPVDHSELLLAPAELGAPKQAAAATEVAFAEPFEPYAKLIETHLSRLPRSPSGNVLIEGVEIRVSEILRLAEKMDAAGNGGGAGVRMRVKGLTVDQGLAEFRLAGRIREILDSELKQSTHPAFAGNPQYSVADEVLGHLMRNPQATISRGLSEAEARGILGVAKNETAAGIHLAGQSASVTWNREAVDAAVQKLTSPKNPMSSLHHLSERLGCAPESFLSDRFVADLQASGLNMLNTEERQAVKEMLSQSALRTEASSRRLLGFDLEGTIPTEILDARVAQWMESLDGLQATTPRKNPVLETIRARVTDGYRVLATGGAP